jgi:hypothetical protein
MTAERNELSQMRDPRAFGASGECIYRRRFLPVAKHRCVVSQRYFLPVFRFAFGSPTARLYRERDVDESTGVML